MSKIFLNILKKMVKYKNEKPLPYQHCVVRRSISKGLGGKKIIFAWLSLDDDEYHWNVDTFDTTYCFNVQDDDEWEYVKK